MFYLGICKTCCWYSCYCLSRTNLNLRLSVLDFVSQLWRKMLQDKIRNGKPGFEANQAPHFWRTESQKLFRFLFNQIHCYNLMQEIQFLEFMGEESNLTHAHSNCLFCMFFIRINGRYIYICALWNSEVSVGIPKYFINSASIGTVPSSCVYVVVASKGGSTVLPISI